MTLFNRMSESATLVSGMATRLDIDLGARIAAAPEAAAVTFASMVQRCAHCPEHAACTRLQEENPLLDKAPEYCMNGATLRRAQG